jgi:NADH:ubiquinone oxidoreductase subunit F (NADH-binding)
VSSVQRLLAGVGAGPMSYADHREIHGPSIRFHGSELRTELASCGLRGRGGGGFPLSAKIDAVTRRRRRPVLVVNGCEGEPMSGKDRVLLQAAPHLVIDGAFVVGDAIGADRILFAVDELDAVSEDALEGALDERSRRTSARRPEIARIPPGYVSGQETALVSWMNGRPARPTVMPPRVSDRGVEERPTLVSNAETLAHAALIARHGARWFAEVGVPEDPGTSLVTVGGAVSAPGVYEIELGLPLAALLRDAGGPTAGIGGVLIGGYAGGWIACGQIGEQRLDRASVERVGARLGAGVVVVLPASGCPVAETARTAEWMALESAGQCGPCVHGLAAVARSLEDVRSGRGGRAALGDVVRWSAQIPGRGACAHPDGTVALVASAVRVFREAFLDHAEHGPCAGCDRPPVLQTPGLRLGPALR